MPSSALTTAPAAGLDLTAKALVVSLALAVSLVFGLPQILYFADGHYDALIHAPDEAPYVARVQEVMDGHWRVSDQYLWETKASPAVLPYTAELFLGAIGVALRLDIDTLIVLIRFVSSAGLAIAITWFAFSLTRSIAWAIIAAALVLLEPGAYFYQPFHYLTSLLAGHPDYPQLHLLYPRFHNPVVMSIPCVLALAGIYRALQTTTRSAIHVAALLLGLNFYTQVFYFAYLYAALGVLVVMEYRNTARVRTVLTIAVLGLAWGSYALLEQLLRTHAMQGQDILTRGGLLVQTRDPIYLLPKALLAGGFLFALLARPRDLAYKWLLSGLVGGYLLLNQNLITGKDIQNYHFNYANAIVFGVALVVAVRPGLNALGRSLAPRWRHAGAFGTAAVVAWLLGNAATLQASTYRRHMNLASIDEGMYPSNLKAEFRETLEWIRGNTALDAVFLADPEISFVIPIYTSGNVFLDPVQNDHVGSFISEPALFERWMIHLKLQRMTSPELFEEVRYRPGAAFPGWGYGRNDRLLAKYDFSTAVGFLRALQTDDLAKDYLREFEQFDFDRIPDLLGKYRLDYLVVRDAAPRFRDQSLASLQTWGMHQVARIDREGVTIYRIERRV